MDWYPFYWRQYRIDTRHLTLAEDGAYRRLLDEYFDTRRPLPSDDRALARIVGVSLSEWAPIAHTVRRFFVLRDGELFHKRVEIELDAQDKRQKRLSEQAKVAARARHSKHNELTAAAMPAAGAPSAAAMPEPATRHRQRQRQREIEVTVHGVSPAPNGASASLELGQAKKAIEERDKIDTAVWTEWVQDTERAARASGITPGWATIYAAEFEIAAARPSLARKLTPRRRAEAVRRFRDAGWEASLEAIEVYVDLAGPQDYRYALGIAQRKARLTTSERRTEEVAHRNKYPDGLAGRASRKARENLAQRDRAASGNEHSPQASAVPR